MEQLTHTPNRLILREIPWFAWIAGGILALGSVIPLFVFTQAELNCRRYVALDGFCRITHRSWFAASHRRIPLDRIQEAVVFSQRGSRGRISYQVRILTHDGRFDLGQATSDQAWGQYVSQRLNYFLQTPTVSQLKTQQDNRAWGTVIFLGVLATGLGIVFWMGKVLIVDLNKTTGLLTLRYYGIWGQDRKQYPLRQVNHVELESHRSSKGQITYRVALQLDSGEQIPLRHFYSSGRHDKEKTIEQIRAFLQLRN